MRALLTDYTFQVVALGSAILGVISGVLGCFAVLRKESLLGDGVSHAALPGVVIIFLLTGSKNTEILLLGAFVSGILASLSILGIVKGSRVKFDAVLALIMSSFFGLGMVLITYTQKIPNAQQAGLSRFIFGQASALLQRDVIIMAIVGAMLMLLVILFWKEFKVFTFDKEFAQIIGFSTQKLNILLSLMIVLSIIVGLQTVGVILMSAMLISPAVAARQWTNRLHSMVILAGIFGAVSGVVGTAISSLVPKMPTGPTVVVCSSVLVLVSLLFAPERGIVFRVIRRKRTRNLLLVEEGGVK